MESGENREKSNGWGKITFYSLLTLAAIIIPPYLWHADLPFVSITHPGYSTVYFRIFTTTATVALLIIAFVEYRRRRGALSTSLITVIIPVVILFNILYQMCLCPQKTYDYECYERAATAVVNGKNPYAPNYRPYLYPPLTAQIMAGGFKLIKCTFPHVYRVNREAAIWNILFYFYQCGQFLSVVFAYFLCCRLLRLAGINEVNASIIAGVILVFNTPLMMTLGLKQVNVWLMDLILLAILYQRRYPTISAIAVAIGGHIKLYALILLLPWILKKKFGAVIATIVAFFAIAFIYADFGRDWVLWHQYYAYASSLSTHYQPTANGLYSIMHNFLNVIFITLRIDRANFQAVLNVAVILLTVLFIAWFLIRFFQREKSLSLHARNAPTPGPIDVETYKLVSHAVDAVILALLISSVVWHHHYVLALPAVLWAYATSHGNKRWLVGIFGALIFCLPPLHILPFKYIQLAALLALTYICRFDKPPFADLSNGGDETDT